MADLIEKTVEQVEVDNTEKRKKIIKLVIIVAVIALAIWLAKKFIF